MARSPARGEEARPGHPVHPRAAQTGAALSRADQDHPGHLGLSAPRCDAAGRSSRFGCRAVEAKVRHYRPLIERIIAQTERRVLAGEPVPASEKLVSLFE